MSATLIGYVHTKCQRPDYSLDTLSTVSVEVRENILDWQAAGLSYTRSGYGRKIPTTYMVKFNGRWRRVYCCIFSNSGTCYIGNFGRNETEVLIVDIHHA